MTGAVKSRRDVHFLWGMEYGDRRGRWGLSFAITDTQKNKLYILRKNKTHQDTIPESILQPLFGFSTRPHNLPSFSAYRQEIILQHSLHDAQPGSGCPGILYLVHRESNGTNFLCTNFLFWEADSNLHSPCSYRIAISGISWYFPLLILWFISLLNSRISK